MYPHAHPPTPALVVIAKAPVPGNAKTRLSPPLSHRDASLVAEAALADTLAAVAATPARRRVLVLDGEPGWWLPPGIEVIPQRGGDFATRLAGAFTDVGEPSLLIGMDTPQVSSELLSCGLDLLAAPDCDAVVGRAEDGGYWVIGLAEADARVFDGVPMSTRVTGARQIQRLHELGLRTRMLRPLRDIDHYEDALAVAAAAPSGRVAAAMRRIAGERWKAAV